MLRKNGRPDGTGPALEMLNVLRITDLPQVAGLMFPKQLISIGDFPNEYQWVKDLYQKLGSPQNFKKVEKLSEWKGNP